MNRPLIRWFLTARLWWKTKRSLRVYSEGLRRWAERCILGFHVDMCAEHRGEARILAQSLAPGSSPRLMCRMHGISSGQLYNWRKQFQLAQAVSQRRVNGFCAGFDCTGGIGVTGACCCCLYYVSVTIVGIELLRRVPKGQFSLGRLGVQGQLRPLSGPQCC